jgi:hypothetical protein
VVIQAVFALVAGLSWYFDRRLRRRDLLELGRSGEAVPVLEQAVTVLGRQHFRRGREMTVPMRSTRRPADRPRDVTRGRLQRDEW